MPDQFPDKIQEPTFPQFTNLALSEGVVDQLMTTVEHHINKQFKAQRLRGTDAAQVYIGLIDSVLQYSTTYLLGIMLIDEQKAKLDADVSLTAKQEEEIDAKIAFVELEKQRLEFEIEQLFPLQKIKLQAEIDLLGKQEALIDAQILKVTEEITTMQAQVTLWVKQGLKIDKEIDFLTAKIVTENANTVAGVAAANSLIGRQMSLLAAQKLGFAGDIQVKAAKLHADYDAVFQSVQEVPAAATLGGNAIGVISSALSTAGAISGA